MKILLIPDKFKGSLSAEEVIKAVSIGLLKAIPKVKIHAVLASDGGEGFLDAVSRYTDAEKVSVSTVDALGRAIKADYLIDTSAAVAYIELAKASGLILLKPEERHPGITSTQGTGILIVHAIQNGAKTIYVGLGGSASNDGGIGMARVFGYDFLDDQGRQLEPIGNHLHLIDSIRRSKRMILPQDVKVFAVHDVLNPLYGISGAAMVYGEQKGGSIGQLQDLDEGLQQLDLMVQRDVGMACAMIPGSGAAGGSAYGLKVFANAEFISGTDFLFKMAGVHEFLDKQSADYIITGEGRIDEQTLHGKLIHGVIGLGEQYGIPVIAVCGRLEIDPELLKASGLSEVIVIGLANRSLEYNMANASRLTTEAIHKYFSSGL